MRPATLRTATARPSNYRAPTRSGTVQRLLDAEALGFALPQTDVELRRILSHAVHLLADSVEAVLGLATGLYGKVEGLFNVVSDCRVPVGSAGVRRRALRIAE